MKLMKSRWLIFGVVGFCLLIAFSIEGAELPLVRDGEPYARIVVGGDVSPAARFAAKELQRYVEKATGAILPIVDHLGEDEQVELVIGAGQIASELGVSVEELRRDGFRVKTLGRRIVILGRDDAGMDIEASLSSNAIHKTEHATLFGVYDFLEKNLGVRWYLPIDIGEVVPHFDELVVEPLDYEDGPAKLWRMIHVYYGADDRDDPMPAKRDGKYVGGFFPGFEGLERTEFVKRRNLFFLRQRHSTVKHWGSHTMWKLVGPERYGESNPDYFALFSNNKRGIDWNSVAHSHHCFTHPGVIQAVVEDARAYFRGRSAKSRNLGSWSGIAWDTPWGDAFHIAPDDSFTPCLCDRCQAAREGLPEGVDMEAELVWEFIFQVAEAVGAEFPEAIISTQAYGPLKASPQKPLPENVIVVPLAVAGPYAEFIPGQDESDGSKVEEWVSVTGKERLGFYHYALKGGWEHGNYKSHKSICGSCPRAYAGWYGRYADVGQGTYMYQMSHTFAYDHLSTYVFYKFHWNPRREIDALLGEYYSLFYGPASEPMSRFWEEVEQQFRKTLSKVVDVGLGPQAVAHDEQDVWGEIYGPETMQRWRGYFAEAEERVKAHADPIYGRRVAYMKRNVLELIEEGYEEFQRVAEGGLKTRMEVGYANRSPVIDGRVDEKIWSEVEPQGMVVIDSREKPEQDTEIRALWDEEYLYLSFVCREPDMDNVKVDQTVNERVSVWRNNGVELFLDPADRGRTFYQWLFNSRGIWADFYTYAKGMTSVEWNSGFRMAVEEFGDRYEAELAIPFPCMPQGKPKSGDVWRASFVRKRVLKEQDMNQAAYYTWSPYLRRDMGFHRGVAFGRLDFVVED
jgi:hypothetical protein